MPREPFGCADRGWRPVSVTFAVRVRPGASRVRVGGRYDGPLGPALLVAVTARAVDGQATAATLAAVAEALGLPRRTVEVRTGHRSRDKLLVVTDPPEDLGDRLNRLRDTPDTTPR